MLKVDRTSRTLSRLDKPTLIDAQILERADLQEYIYNSSNDFFAEIGERIFVIGKEVTPSQTVQDRIDLLGIDSDFRKTATSDAEHQAWSEVGSNEATADDDVEIE